ncbi:MAG: exodeoxyribonuclease VII large subunit [Planctomycetaceae bacterium]|jgi:exodeoxyribonuclease VII large subunit|nr:exodeoxyribonuclease VII large subunit [Planctomycetaceae bacterium]
MNASLFDFEDADDMKVLQSSGKVSRKILKSSPKTKLPETKTPEKITPEMKTPETVTGLTFRLKGLLESGIGEVYVVGEVSNFSRPKSGHVYFTLKDKRAGISAIIWQSTYSRLKFTIEEGMELVCRGRIEVYPPSGRYQLILTKVEPKGIGGLELAFRQLRERLDGEGLFDVSRKRRLPLFVRNIALVTSSTGAAVRDFLQVLRRRTRLVDVLLVPVQVQGEGAVGEIVSAIQILQEIAAYRKIDCIALVRGGGSVEDLWTFNEELLVRAVASSRIPVVCGIGHEVDVTLCDLAADVRALTPSEAAERIAVKDAELAERLTQLGNIIDRNIDAKLNEWKNKLDYCAKHPAIIKPKRIIENKKRIIEKLDEKINYAIDKKLNEIKQRLQRNIITLDAISPLATLARGYSITETQNGKNIKSIKQVKQNEKIRTKLKDGQIESYIVEIKNTNFALPN